MQFLSISTNAGAPGSDFGTWVYSEELCVRAALANSDIGRGRAAPLPFLCIIIRVNSPIRRGIVDPNIITLAVATVGIAGTLCGVLIGHFLTRSWQRKQWLQDRRKEEFRELMTYLLKALRSMAMFGMYSSQKRQRAFSKERMFPRVATKRCMTGYISQRMWRGWACCSNGPTQLNHSTRQTTQLNSGEQSSA